MSTLSDNPSPPAAKVFECRICLEFPTDPVATVCGHVYCWPCIYRWLETGPKPCPVCKSYLEADCNILPLHTEPAGSTSGAGSSGGGSEAQASNISTGVPPRPSSPLFFMPDVDFDDPEQPGKTPGFKAVCAAFREGTRMHNMARIKAIMRLAPQGARLDVLRQVNKDLNLLEIGLRNRIVELQMQLGSLIQEELDSHDQQQLNSEDQQHLESQDEESQDQVAG